jgi:hypothetical protein
VIINVNRIHLAKLGLIAGSSEHYNEHSGSTKAGAV